jgi:hypothetical protein
MRREPLTDLHPPKAPPALRQRVLLAARRAAQASETSWLERWVDQLWGSRALRLAFWAATAMLLLAHLGVQLQNRGGRLAVPGQAAAPNELAVALGIEPQNVPPERGATLATYHPIEKIEELGL